MAGNLTVNNLACATVNDKSMATHVLENGLGGSGQTMQDVTASRAFNTTYTNSTGKPIIVYFTTNTSVTDRGFNININSVFTLSFSGYAAANPAGGSFLVPIGATYAINPSGGNTLNKWSELR